MKKFYVTVPNDKAASGFDHFVTEDKQKADKDVRDKESALLVEVVDGDVQEPEKFSEELKASIARHERLTLKFNLQVQAKAQEPASAQSASKEL